MPPISSLLSFAVVIIFLTGTFLAISATEVNGGEEADNLTASNLTMTQFEGEKDKVRGEFDAGERRWDWREKEKSRRGGRRRSSEDDEWRRRRKGRCEEEDDEDEDDSSEEDGEDDRRRRVIRSKDGEEVEEGQKQGREEEAGKVAEGQKGGGQQADGAILREEEEKRRQRSRSSSEEGGCRRSGRWSKWRWIGECSDECGGFGRRTRVRRCLSERCPCRGKSCERKRCNRTPCVFPRLSCAPGLRIATERRNRGQNRLVCRKEERENKGAEAAKKDVPRGDSDNPETRNG